MFRVVILTEEVPVASVQDQLGKRQAEQDGPDVL